MISALDIKRHALFYSCACLLFCLLPIFSKAQVNYVHNPSFEQYSQCPTDWDQITYANYWSAVDSTYDPNGIMYGRPDYCNMCAGTNLYSGIIANFDFNHYPRSKNGMVEVQMFFDQSYNEQNKRDYLQGRLIHPLTAGTTYCVSFYVTREQASAYANNHIGAYLDDGSIDTNHCAGCVLSQYSPQVFENDVIDDTLNWYKVEGNFTANGTERFITIANFFDTAHTTYRLATNPGSNNFSFYLVDDVSVVESDLPAFAGNDTTILQGDTILIGRNEEGLDCKWYTNNALIDSGAGIRVHPDTTTTYVVEQNVCGLNKYDTVTVTVWPLGVNELKTVGFNIYPNPTQNSFTVSTSGLVKGRLKIYNAVGQMVYAAGLSSDKQLVNLDVPDGVYVLEVTNNDGAKKQQRLIINK